MWQTEESRLPRNNFVLKVAKMLLKFAAIDYANRYRLAICCKTIG